MSVDVASLERRAAAALRAFARAQHVSVERRPDGVAPASADEGDYGRFLPRRVALEGVCAHYQTYDASGDENDWNLNIHPDPAYQWMLDPQILCALSLNSGAPSPIDLTEIKYYACSPAIECELTPDDGLYDKFVSAGLPITSGGWWPDGAEQQGKGPTGARVGVYGVFAGDYGHGGRPEIHPFDAFWRRFHGARSNTINWDLGVFQDDSNRFNSDWSRAPIDVEFHVPFCLDFPVSLRTAVATRARFTLRRSPLCSVVGKNARARVGPSEITETFTGATVTLNPRARNRLDVSVEDRTGLPGNPFSLGLGDLTYTSTAGLVRWRTRAWLAGTIVVRVAVDQDGFAYWRLSGPNSPTAADAASGEITIPPPVNAGTLRAATPSARQPTLKRIRTVEVRPEIPGEGGTLAAEVVIEQLPESGPPARQALTVRAREEPIVVVDGDTVELESFDLFATARVEGSAGSGSQMRYDITAAICRLAGLDRLGRRLESVPVTIEVDELVTVGLSARYAPYRDGSVQGEERSMLSESITRAVSSQYDVRCDARITHADGEVRRLATASGPQQGSSLDSPAVTIAPAGAGYRITVGPLGSEPITVWVNAILEDAFGLQAHTSALVDNYRLVEPRRWVEQVSGISLDELKRRRERIERACRSAPDPEALAARGLIRCLVGVIETLDGTTAPAARVAGAIRIAARVGELMPPIGRP